MWAVSQSSTIFRLTTSSLQYMKYGMDRLDAIRPLSRWPTFRVCARPPSNSASPSGVTRLIAALEERLGARLCTATTRRWRADRRRRALSGTRQADILAMSRAEGSAQGERTGRSGVEKKRAVGLGAIGFGRASMSARDVGLLTRYPRSRVNCDCRTACSSGPKTCPISRSG